MAFDNIRFPTDISYGSSAGPGFKTQIIELRSGAEERISRWSAPRHQYDLGYGVRTYAALTVVKRFFLARRGSKQAWRLLDWQDYTTTSSGTLYQPNDIAVASNDQDLLNTISGAYGIGDGSTRAYRMVKTYPDDIEEFRRSITLPIQGTVLLEVNGSLQTETTHYSVNYLTGEVTFVTAPPFGQTVRFGCQFDVPARFDISVDEWLRMSFDDFGDGSYPSIKAIEVTDEVIVPDRVWPGGVKDHGSVSVDVTANLSEGKVHRVDPLTGGLAIILQRADDIPPGGIVWIVQNASGVNALALRTTDGTTIVSIPISRVADVSISDDGAGLKTYIASVSS